MGACRLGGEADHHRRPPSHSVCVGPLPSPRVKQRHRRSRGRLGTGRHLIEVAYKDAQSPPREVIVRSLVECACKESSPKDVAVLLGPIGSHAVSSKYAVDADLSTKLRRLPAAKSTRISTLISIC